MSAVRRFRRSRLLRYLPAVALLFAALNLFAAGFAFPENRLLHWLAIATVLMGTVDFVYKRTTAIELTAWSIRWRPAPLRKEREVVFSMVEHWGSVDRKLVFTSRQGETTTINLGELGQDDRNRVLMDLRSALPDSELPAV